MPSENIKNAINILEQLKEETRRVQYNSRKTHDQIVAMLVVNETQVHIHLDHVVTALETLVQYFASYQEHVDKVAGSS